MRLALSLLTSLLVLLLTLPAMAQEVVVNQYVTEASSERVVEVSSLDAGLWLHLAPVDRNGLVLGALTPVCRAPCSERIAMGLYGASVSTSDSDPVAASGVINVDHDLNLQLAFNDNSGIRIGSGIAVGLGILYAIGAIIAGAVLPESSNLTTPLLSTGITVGILSLCFAGVPFTPDEAAVRVIQF
jgi:hypothetical protein